MFYLSEYEEDRNASEEKDHESQGDEQDRLIELTAGRDGLFGERGSIHVTVGDETDREFAAALLTAPRSQWA